MEGRGNLSEKVERHHYCETTMIMDTGHYRISEYAPSKGSPSLRKDLTEYLLRNLHMYHSRCESITKVGRSNRPTLSTLGRPRFKYTNLALSKCSRPISIRKTSLVG